MPEPSPDLARLLRITQRSLERRMMKRVAAVGLDMLRPGHMTVLRVLDPGETGMRMVDLARDADVTRQAIQQIVTDLERLNIVETLADPADRRARRIRYTPYGRDGYGRCMQEFVALEREVAQALGEERLRELKALLSDLERAVDEHGDALAVRRDPGD